MRSLPSFRTRSSNGACPLRSGHHYWKPGRQGALMCPITIATSSWDTMKVAFDAHLANFARSTITCSRGNGLTYFLDDFWSDYCNASKCRTFSLVEFSWLTMKRRPQKPNPQFIMHLRRTNKKTNLSFLSFIWTNKVVIGQAKIWLFSIGLVFLLGKIFNIKSVRMIHD